MTKARINIPADKLAVRTGNRLIHGYDSVDLSILWDEVELDCPPLIAQIENILDSGA